MKIKKLNIENFRNIGSTELNLKKVNYIFGLNNSGKTSLIAACQYAICNSTHFTNRLEDLENKTPEEDSFKGSQVSVELEKVGIISRYRKSAAQTNRLNGLDIPDKEIVSEVKNSFGFSYDTIELMFDGAKFTSMQPKEQKAFLLRLMGIPINAEQIVKYMDNPSNAAKEKLTNTINSLFGEGATLLIDDIEKIYKEFFGERKVMKKTFSTTITEYNAKVSSIPKEKPRLTKFIDKDIKTLQAQKEEIAKILNIYNERITAKENMSKTINKAKQDLEDAKKDIVEDIDISNEYLQGLEKGLQELETSLKVDLKEHSVLSQSKKTFESMKDKLDTNKCPLSDKLVCNTDKTPLLNDFAVEIEKAEKRIKELVISMEKITKQIENIKGTIKLIGVQQSLVKIRDNALNSLSNLIESEKSIEIPNIDGIQEKLNIINSSLSDFEKEKMEAIAYGKLVKEKDVLNTKKNEEEIEVQLLEYLVTELAPNGVRSRILKKIVEPLTNKATSEISKLTNGYSLEFSIDGDDFIVNVKTNTGIIPLSLLSESEKLRVQIVIQDTINSLTGVGVLVIDEAGILDKDNFNKLALVINEYSNTYDTIFVLATKEKEDAIEFAKSKFIDTLKSNVFWMENGNVETM